MKLVCKIGLHNWKEFNQHFPRDMQIIEDGWLYVRKRKVRNMRCVYCGKEELQAVYGYFGGYLDEYEWKENLK